MNRALIPIFLIVLVDVFGLTLVLPLQAIYAEHFGASQLQAMAVVARLRDGGREVLRLDFLAPGAGR